MSKLYCLYDTGAEQAGPIFEAHNDLIARRIFDAMTEFPPGATKKDFKVMCLGFYNHEKPLLMGLSKARNIINSRIESPPPPEGFYDEGVDYETVS